MQAGAAGASPHLPVLGAPERYVLYSYEASPPRGWLPLRVPHA
jgi:hypothetical protein